MRLGLPLQRIPRRASFVRPNKTCPPRSPTTVGSALARLSFVRPISVLRGTATHLHSQGTDRNPQDRRDAGDPGAGSPDVTAELHHPHAFPRRRLVQSAGARAGSSEVASPFSPPPRRDLRRSLTSFGRLLEGNPQALREAWKAPCLMPSCCAVGSFVVESDFGVSTLSCNLHPDMQPACGPWRQGATLLIPRSQGTSRLETGNRATETAPETGLYALIFQRPTTTAAAGIFGSTYSHAMQRCCTTSIRPNDIQCGPLYAALGGWVNLLNQQESHFAELLLRPGPHGCSESKTDHKGVMAQPMPILNSQYRGCAYRRRTAARTK